MKIDVEQLMSGLRTDHRNMALLLDLLEMETERLAASGEPDYDLMRDIMLYMTEYPDVVHHPKEDLIYQRLRSLHPEIDDDLKRVETDHQNIEKSGLTLKNDIEAMSVGADLNRDEIIDNLRQYIGQLREHMYWEEKELFTLADELQSDGDWSAVVLKNDEIGDPLFGPWVERKYRRLLARIQRLVVWDCQKYLA